MDGWNTTFLLRRPIFRGYVSFREGILPIKNMRSAQKCLVRLASLAESVEDFQENYNTPLEHTPGNPPSQL